MRESAICGLQVNRRLRVTALAESATRRRIESLMGLPSWTLEDRFHLANLWAENEIVRESEAGHRVHRGLMALRELGVKRAVFLGATARDGVSSCLGLGKVPWLQWYPDHVSGLTVAVSPHPSPRNRWWNDEENVERARDFWQDLRDKVSRHDTTTCEQGA